LNEQLTNKRDSYDKYLEAIRLAGGDAVEIPLNLAKNELAPLIESLDAYVLSGGPADVDPQLYHAARSEKSAAADAAREQTDFAILGHAFAEHKPVLGICYGVQSMNVFLGGSLIQDIASEYKTTIQHQWRDRAAGNPEPFHAARIEPNSRLAELSGGGRERMLVQEHIDSVDSQGRPFTYRVLTAFGEPLCMAERGLADPRKPLAEIAADPAGRIATNAEGVSKRANLVVVPDVLALACRVASAFREIPCLGQDIIRDRATGGLYVLETNPGGAVWHLSSDFARPPGYDRAYAARRYAQFNALDVVARQLIARTRAEAS